MCVYVCVCVCFRVCVFTLMSKHVRASACVFPVLHHPWCCNSSVLACASLGVFVCLCVCVHDCVCVRTRVQTAEMTSYAVSGSSRSIFVQLRRLQSDGRTAPERHAVVRLNSAMDGINTMIER